MPRRTKNLVPFSVFLTPEERRALRFTALAQGISAGALLRTALARHLKRLAPRKSSERVAPPARAPRDSSGPGGAAMT